MGISRGGNALRFGVKQVWQQWETSFDSRTVHGIPAADFRVSLFHTGGVQRRTPQEGTTVRFGRGLPNRITFDTSGLATLRLLGAGARFEDEPRRVVVAGVATPGSAPAQSAPAQARPQGGRPIRCGAESTAWLDFAPQRRRTDRIARPSATCARSARVIVVDCPSLSPRFALMSKSTSLAVVLVVSVIAAFGLWQWSQSDVAPPGPAPSAPAGPALAPVAGPATTEASLTTDEQAAAAATSLGIAGSERTATAVPEGVPCLRGRVVSADGAPVVGAQVVAAPGLAFLNANGRFDMAGLDLADLADAGDPNTMWRTTREHLAQRVRTATDAEGRFRLEAPAGAGSVGLRVLARGFAIHDRRVARPAGADVDVGTVSLLAGGMVTGRVLDPSGAPIAEALVRRVFELEERMTGGLEVEEVATIEAERDGEASRTDADGRFELAHLEAGEFDLRARHLDHPVAYRRGLALAVGQTLTEVVITMPRGAEIRGRVIGLPEGVRGLTVFAAKKPRPEADPTGMANMFGGDMSELMADAGMSMGDRSTAVAEDGQFVLRGLARERYRVWIAQRGAGFAGGAICSQRVEAVAGDAVVELRYEAGVAVTFVAVDAVTGQPVESLWVVDRLRGGGGMADAMAMAPRPSERRSYPGGRVTLAHLRPKAKQTLSLTLEALGYRGLERTGITLPSLGALDLGTLRLEPHPVVRVQVVADATGTPVRGAKARLRRAGAVTSSFGPFGRMAEAARGGGGPTVGTTDRDGRCTLNAPTEAGRVVAVEHVDFAPFVGDALPTVEPGGLDVVVRLHLGGQVTVTVARPDQQPAAAAVVEHRDPQGSVAQRKADGQGQAVFVHLAPGKHGFRLGRDEGPMGFVAAQVRRPDETAAAGEAAWQEVVVADGAAAAVALEQAPSATLRGIVRENGVPLAGARVAFVEGAADDAADAPFRMMGEVMGGLGGDGPRSSKTDELGAYTLRDLPPGMHRLRVSHRERAMPNDVTVELRTGEITFDVDLATTTVRGVVRDPDGAAVAGARVRVRPRPQGDEVDPMAAMEGLMPGLGGGGTAAKSDASGGYALRGVPSEVELEVTATAKGFAAAVATTTVAAGEVEVELDLQVALAGKVKLVVRGDAPFVPVRAKFVGDATPPVPSVVRVLGKGGGTLDGLRPGRWEIECEGGLGGDAGAGAPQGGAQGGAPRGHLVEVVAGQTVTLEITP